MGFKILMGGFVIWAFCLFTAVYFGFRMGPSRDELVRALFIIGALSPVLALAFVALLLR